MANRRLISTIVFLIFILPFTVSALEPALEQGEVWGPEQEKISGFILEQTKRIINKSKVPGQKTHRDAHPKAHGCVKAQWNFLNSDLRPEQRVGIFNESSTPIPAWVRFSNGAPDGYNAPDSETDIRGMAIKLMTSQGNQDFVMINSPRFFSRDGEDYYHFFQAIQSGNLALIWYLIQNPTNALIISRAKVSIDNVLTTTYFSPVPLKLGNQSMRIKVVPCEANLTQATKVDKTHQNFLRENLLLSLQSNPACYEFYVQPNNEPAKNNIEDPTLVWDEKVSPFIRVARLDILKQDDFATPERMNFCENLSFNPWHTRPETRPMGQINRIRQLVYDSVSKYRHSANQTPEIEPVDHNACLGPTAALCK